MKNENRKNGTAFEQRLCLSLSAYGFWAHNLAQNKQGQPFDVMASRNGCTHPKFGEVVHQVGDDLLPVQKVNRVYATDDYRHGTLYKTNLDTGKLMKVPSLPANCVVDNDNSLTIEVIDRDWYIRLAKRYVNDFLGKKPPKRHTRRVNTIKKKMMALWGDEA